MGVFPYMENRCLGCGVYESEATDKCIVEYASHHFVEVDGNGMSIRNNEMEKDIQLLTEELKNARIAYYNLDPIMSDQEYDAKKERLKELNPDNEEIFTVGATPLEGSNWPKVKHEMPMGSLDKVNSEEEFRKWVEGTKANQFLITHKIDGSSMEIVYENGRLIRCVTRGDGIVGEDVTQNVRKVNGVLKEIRNKSKTTVRGEVVMLKQVFQEKYTKYANPRNTAAAKIREKKNSGADCVNLNFLAYTLIVDGLLFGTETEQFQTLKSFGFNVPWNSTGDVEATCQSFIQNKTNREQIVYEIDGMVTRVDNLQIQEELGEIDMKPKGQIAWKFDPAASMSRAIEVKWQVGLTGRVTPVLVVDPVQIGGVTITNISLHNLAMFRELKLKPGDRVIIERRNDVIPYVRENLDVRS